ncbi:MAG: tryptophan--tRNA ligase [Candidatus Cloacimonadota bacterium]|nr:MAG: tryptophan--tRNA ligase [Candidatus Cloacimonadota bacterium]
MNKVIVSGIQPTGSLNIGTYIGAMKNWKELQNDYDCMYMVVDMHSITVRPDPKELRNRCLSFVAQYIACGIDPDKNTLFIQSHVRQHAELAWILNCYTSMGELNRMTQFKEKSQKSEANINSALFTYPVLMAADILLYQADLVPVGQDQKQHLELTRDVAHRFNSHHNIDVFKVPEPFIPKQGAKIMSLQDPTSKMSKSDNNLKATVALLDDSKLVLKKLKSAVTDSEDKIIFDEENKPGISNLITIYSAITGMSYKQVEQHFKDKRYGHLKIETAECLNEFLSPIRNTYSELMDDEAYLLSILKKGAEKASEKAEKTLEKVKAVIGFLPI